MIDGLDADVVTLALAGDIDAIAEKTDKLPTDWQSACPQQLALHLDNRVPRSQGQSQGHQGLGRPGQARRRGHHAQSQDLGRGALELSGRLGLGARPVGGDEAKAKAYVADLFRNVPVLDTGARGSTTTFAQRGLGDVFLSWENEAFLALKEFGADKFEIVVPTASILAEPPVAVVDDNVNAKGTRKVAEAYLEFLYSPRARSLPPSTSIGRASRRWPRPRNSPASRRSSCSPSTRFGGWNKAQATHFADGGVFDQIYKPSN